MQNDIKLASLSAGCREGVRSTPRLESPNGAQLRRNHTVDGLDGVHGFYRKWIPNYLDISKNNLGNTIRKSAILPKMSKKISKNRPKSGAVGRQTTTYGAETSHRLYFGKNKGAVYPGK